MIYRDRGEIFDLAATYPEKLAELLRLWERYRIETGVVETPLSVFDAAPAAAWTRGPWSSTEFDRDARGGP